MEPEEYLRTFGMTDGAAPVNTPALYGGAGQEDEGTIGHILHILALLDRPRNALATGVQNVLDEDPTTGFWGGAKAGIMGEKETPWVDVIGLPRAKSTDDWAPWLGKAGLEFGLDAVLDPLNLFFGIGGLTKGAQAAGKVGKFGQLAQEVRRATGITKLGEEVTIPALEKAGQWARGSRLGKHLSMRGDPELEQLIMSVRRSNDVQPLMDVAKETESTLRQYFEKYNIPQKTAQEIVERVPLAFEKGLLGEGVTQELLDIYRPLRTIQKTLETERIDLMNELASKWGSKKSTGLLSAETLRGGEYYPHLQTGRGRFAGSKLGTLEFDPQGMREQHRMLTSWIDDEGNVLRVSKWDKPPRNLHTVIDEKTGEQTYWMRRPGVKDKELEWRPDQEGFWHPTKGRSGAQVFESRPPFLKDAIQVEPRMATLDEIEQAGILTGGWQKDPAKAYLTKALKAREATQYMRILSGLEGAEDMNGMRRVMTGLLDEQIPKTHRRLKIPGFEDLVVSKVNANRLENLSNFSKPSEMVGILNKFIDETKLGQAMDSYTRWWKRNTLALFPGFYAANAISDFSLAILAGLTNPNTVRQGYMIRGLKGKVLHKGAQVVDGIPNHILRDELRKRDVVDRGLINILGEPAAKDTLVQSNRVPFLEMATEKIGAVGRGVKRAGDKLEWLNNEAFKIGAFQEEGLKAALAIDWLKKNVRKGISPTPEQLDQAALHAREALFDYGDLPMLQDALKRLGGVPFIAWYSNIMRSFLKTLKDEPQALARMGRLYDFTFRPINGEDREILPGWMRENGPSQIPDWWPKWLPGAAGDVALMGRFLPHGTLEQLWMRPGQNLFNMLGPQVKGPVEMGFNYSMFKDKTIDELAKSGYAGGLINPVAALAGANAPYELADKTTFPGVRMPAAWEHLMSTYLPYSRMLNTASTLGSGFVFEDPTRMPQTAGQKVGWVLSGGKTWEFDRQKAMATIWRDFTQQKNLLKKKMRFAEKRSDRRAYEHYQAIYRQMVADAPLAALRGSQSASLMGESAD